MMRIKKKFILTLFFGVFFVFIYFYLNSNVPKDQRDMLYNELKLKKSEYDSKKPRHHFKGEVDLKDVDKYENFIKEEPELNNPDKDLIKEEQIIPRNSNDKELSCNLNEAIIPKPDIQMLEAYREIPFDNPGNFLKFSR